MPPTITLNSLTVGPLVGHADTDSVRLWGRGLFEATQAGAPRRCFGAAQVRSPGWSGDDGWSRVKIFKMNPNFDLTGLAIFTGLMPETRYEYRMGCFFSDKELEEFEPQMPIDWQSAHYGEFKTASADSTKSRELVFGSCRYLLRLFGGSWFDDRGDKTFRSIVRQLDGGEPIDRLLMVGDQIYADDLNFIGADTRPDEFNRRYRDAFSQPYIRELMGRVSTCMTLDDHEIEDNWPSNADGRDLMVKYPAAIHAYQTYQMSHSPLIPLDQRGRLDGTPDRFHYRFFDGCCDFFVTDTRTERDPDGGEIIGQEQMEALLAWLGDGSGRVKLVVSSVPFFPDTRKANDDKWSHFLGQRDRIVDHIRAKGIRKVVFLSGDVHCSMSAEMVVDENNGLKIVSIISSSFYWPYPHMKRRQFQLEGSVRSASRPHGYPLGKVSKVVSDDNFTRVRVSRNELWVRVYSRKGDQLMEQRFEI